MFNPLDYHRNYILSDRRDSNPRPSAWEANALPTEPLSHFVRKDNTFFLPHEILFPLFKTFHTFCFALIKKSDTFAKEML